MLTAYLVVQPPNGFIDIKGTVSARAFLNRLTQERWTQRHAVAIEYDPTNASVVRLIETCLEHGYDVSVYGSELIAHGLPASYQVKNWVGANGTNLGASYRVYPPVVIAAMAVLELDGDLTDAAVKRQYKQLALKYHPDKGCTDPAAFQRVSAAKEVLLAHVATQSRSSRL